MKWLVGDNLKQMKQALTTILLLLTMTVAKAQRVCQVSYRSQANVIAYITQYKWEANLLVYITNYPHEADNRLGIWYYTNNTNAIDWRVFITPYRNEADLIIYFTQYKWEAGFRK